METKLKHRLFGLFLGSILTFITLRMILADFGEKALELVILIGAMIGYGFAIVIAILCLIGIIISGISYLWKRFKK